MTRLTRLALAAVVVAGIVVPAGGALAVPPPCELHWGPFVSTTPGFPVHLEVDRPTHWTC